MLYSMRRTIHSSEEVQVVVKKRLKLLDTSETIFIPQLNKFVFSPQCLDLNVEDKICHVFILEKYHPIISLDIHDENLKHDEHSCNLSCTSLEEILVYSYVFQNVQVCFFHQKRCQL